MTILASVNNKTVMPGITPVADVPDAPTIGTATAGAASGSVTFTPATTGGVPTSYTATSSPGSVTATGASSPITVSGLTPGTSYTFTVTASNSTGTSPASSASNSIVPLVPVDGAYDALATVVVPSGGLSSVIFSSIPTGYKHLQIAGLSRANTAGTNDVTGYLRFNGDSSSNYSTHRIYGYGGGGGGGYDASSSATQISFASVLEGGNTANCFSVVVCDILDYSSSSKFKTTMSISGADTNTLGMVFQTSGNWRSTNPVTSITLFPSSGSFAANTSFELYGVK